MNIHIIYEHYVGIFINISYDINLIRYYIPILPIKCRYIQYPIVVICLIGTSQIK